MIGKLQDLEMDKSKMVITTYRVIAESWSLTPRSELGVEEV